MGTKIGYGRNLERCSPEFWNNAKIITVKDIQKSTSGASTDLHFDIEIYAENAGDYTLDLNKTQRKVSLKKGINTVSVPYETGGMKLWQPNGRGEAHLYDFEVKLAKDQKNIDAKKSQNRIKNGRIGSGKKTKRENHSILK